MSGQDAASESSSLRYHHHTPLTKTVSKHPGSLLGYTDENNSPRLAQRFKSIIDPSIK